MLIVYKLVYNTLMNDMDFKDNLLNVGLTEEQFSTLTNIPLSTVKGWMAKRKNKIQKTPSWVTPYLELYAENRNQKAIIKYFEEKSNGKD